MTSRRSAAALAAACLCTGPALADTSSFALGGSWQRIATSGASVLVSASGAGIFSTAASGASPSLQAGFALPAPICLTLTADLYAIGSGSATVTTGVSCAGGGSSGGSGGGATIANQGTAGSSAWPVLQGGSTGTDASANAMSVPMAGFVLLATVPLASARAFVEVQNQSAGTLQVVRDDGAGNNQTSILLGAGAGAGSQGAGWSSATFKGRIRVYGASGAQLSAYQD